MKTLPRLLCAAALSLMASHAVAANPATVERVTEGLIAAGMAIELGEKCDGVSLRYIRGIHFLQGLKNHLKDLGYSNAEIDAYIDNREEKQRLEGIARERLHLLGVRIDTPSTYCVVARGQIAAATQVGQLLR